eukprot:TRINITY_DN6086_c0_g1_i1.p1 TRINITY_DN6086_c0_g1~~TRINITY_DN6086_c0_g1_i1.p1  ORF type:complete len:313 (-),score=80.72 TRINITY_DN6086_c0_g1_i1:28-894(-)
MTCRLLLSLAIVLLAASAVNEEQHVVEKEGSMARHRRSHHRTKDVQHKRSHHHATPSRHKDSPVSDEEVEELLSSPSLPFEGVAASLEAAKSASVDKAEVAASLEAAKSASVDKAEAAAPAASPAVAATAAAAPAAASAAPAAAGRAKKAEASPAAAAKDEEDEVADDDGDDKEEPEVVNTDLPFADIEPFGRENTAQDLTEASIRESDMMVDQIEKAEIAEENRAVFRALSRLRGAALASFDGIARAHQSNMQEYAKENQFRETHPVKHLANEEADVSKWAFPSTAD